MNTSPLNIFDKYCDEKTLSQIVDYSTVGEMWQHSVACYPNNVAIDGAQKATFAELDKLVAQFRTVLVQNGVTKGDRVGLLMPNCLDFAKAFLAATTLGAVAVLLPAHLDEMTVFGCSMKFGLKALVYFEPFAAKLGLLQQRNPACKLVAATQTSTEVTPAVQVEGTHPATVLFTGGTTGRSKGALLSHRALMRGTKNGCYGYKDVFEQRYILALPLTHVFGLVRNLLTSFYTGSAIYFCQNNKDLFRDVAMFKPTIMVLVPALAEMALNLSKQFGRNMWGDSMKTIICGAATVAPYLVKEYATLGINLLPGYGMTETANLVSGNAEALANPESVGFIYPGMEWKVVDGELWLRGINMMDGYVGDEEENQKSYCDGWFMTGDLVKIDEKGFLYITGRKKEVIVLPTGENVSPAEVENEFYTIDEIQDCLVYEQIFEDGTWQLVLEVLPRPAVVAKYPQDQVEAILKEKIAQVNAKLPSFEKINKVIIRTTDFVRSPSMKIVRGQNKQ